MKQSFIEKVIGLLVVALFVVTTVTFSKSTLDPVLMPRWLSVSIFLGITAMLFLAAPKHKKLKLNLASHKWFWIGAAGFVLIQLVSIFYAVNSAEAMVTSFKWLTWFLFVFIVVQLLQWQIISQIKLIKLLFFSGFIVALLGVLQVFGIDIYKIDDQGHEVKSIMANANLLGSYMVVLFPLGFYLFQQKAFKNNWLIYLFFVLVGSNVIMSASRTAYVILAAEIIVCTIYFLRSRFNAIKLYIIVPLLVAALAAAGLFIYKKTDAYNFSAIVSTNTLKTRTVLVQQTSKLIADAPLFGVGAGNWKTVIPKYGLQNFPEPMQGGTVVYVRPHNDFLWVLAEVGVIGFIFFLLMFFGIFLAIKKAKIFSEKSPSDFYLVASIMAFILAALVDYPSERILHPMAFFAVTSVFLVDHNPAEKQIQIPKYFVFAFGIILFYFAYFSTQRIKGEGFSKKILHAYQTQNGKALLNLFKTDELYFYPSDPMANPLPYFEAMAHAVSGNQPKAIVEFTRALQIHPYHLLTLNNLGAMHKTQKNYSVAKDYYLKALSVSPNYTRAKMNLIEIEFLMNNPVEGTALLKNLDIAETDAGYQYLFDLMLKKQVEYALQRYPELKEDEKYMGALANKKTLKQMWHGSIKNNVPYHLWILPFSTDSL